MMEERNNEKVKTLATPAVPVCILHVHTEDLVFLHVIAVPMCITKSLQLGTFLQYQEQKRGSAALNEQRQRLSEDNRLFNT